MQPLEQVTSNDSVASVELGDYIFCAQHGMERCEACKADFREDNSFTAGCDPEPFRMPIEAEYSMNKDGEPQCKKHKKANCGSCFTFKKQILKLTKEGQKRAKTDARNNPVSNLLV
ncbi:RHTO0S01e00430g1_1 [Rhodotorula toruloides]|uniref:RHTO0S01e00430g1_1 n=1 Tax=Rhodotorula toruloides TaxID=5286 RepID=A0A061AJM4_RHOTO|nr:RHTO0S01e00430g1_1 [Rhodotorula toruloides]